MFGRGFYYRNFYRQLVRDVLWAGLSALAVYLYVFFHLKSFFLSTAAMSQILFSFPITLVIYRVFMRISNIGPLHLMVVFLVLGISADNIFVICDAWVQSESYPQFSGNLKKRMAYTFRRAAKAILATSSTTAFAFLSNGFSSLMPVSAFGFFAFVIVPVNYVLIVFYFPAFLIIYENDIKHKEAIVANCFRVVFCFERRKNTAKVQI
jgi:predicted RND superfamily exporter protein